MRAALTILGKDLRLRSRDRSMLLFAVVVPLGLTVLFSFVFPDTEDLELTAGVVDEDGGEVASAFVDGVLPALVDDGLLTLVDVDDAKDARRQVEDGELDATWIVPEGFSGAVAAGETAELEVLVAAGAGIAGEVARGVADGFVTELEQITLAVAVDAQARGGAPSPERIEALAAASQQRSDVIAVEDLVTGGEDQLDNISYLAAGMASFFVFFVVGTGVIGMLEERSQGTMPRLLAAPIPPGAIQLGKSLGSLIVGLASMAVLAVASSLLLGADWGHPAGVAMLISALVLAAMGVMALVGTFARTVEQAENFQSIVAIILGLFGGAFFPIPGEGWLIEVATAASPHGWFLQGLSELVASGELAAVLPATVAILVVAVVTAVPAVVLQRRGLA